MGTKLKVGCSLCTHAAQVQLDFWQHLPRLAGCSSVLALQDEFCMFHTGYKPVCEMVCAFDSIQNELQRHAKLISGDTAGTLLTSTYLAKQKHDRSSPCLFCRSPYYA
eukprot:2460155-Pleurochrysis_carterae.AAC.6